MKMNRMSREVSIDRLKEIKGDPTILQPVMRYKEPLEMAIEALSQPEIIHCKDCKHSRESKEAFDFDDTPLCECNYMTQSNRWHEFCSWAKRK